MFPLVLSQAILLPWFSLQVKSNLFLLVQAGSQPGSDQLNFGQSARNGKQELDRFHVVGEGVISGSAASILVQFCGVQSYKQHIQHSPDSPSCLYSKRTNAVWNRFLDINSGANLTFSMFE